MVDGVSKGKGKGGGGHGRSNKEKLKDPDPLASSKEKHKIEEVVWNEWGETFRNYFNKTMLGGDRLI